MHIRDYMPGEEAILREVFRSSVRQLAGAYYTDEQIDAWAPAAYDRDKWREKMAANRPFVAVIGNRVAGYADLQAIGHIDHFFVSPEFARRGVGSALMRHIHDVARERGLTRLCADVSLAAEAFFTRHGFVVDRRQSVPVRGMALSNAHMIKAAIGDRHGDG